ncbi:MAG: L-threonylcarbamoyladenylate synthase [Candidatus Omnitrophota bacterium]
METKVVKVNPDAIDQRQITAAAFILEKGGLVAFPTETVYGIAVNLLNGAAVDRLKVLKERSPDKQFSIHIADSRDVERYAIEVLPRAYKVMSHFWPGPLTIVLAAPGEKTIGLRMPKHDVALRLLSSVDFPVIAPSANLAGHNAPRDAETVLQELSGRIEMVLDAGPTPLGVESTVLDARKLPFTVLRQGSLKSQDLLKVVNQKTILFVCTGNSCRSVMAEYLMKKYIKDNSRSDLDVSSAGTFAFFGMGPTHETQHLVGAEGMDASAHHAQRVSAQNLRQADFVLCMERRHQEDLIRQFPSAKSRIHLFGEFVRLEPLDNEVEDPIGKFEDFYKGVFLKIKKAVAKLGEML